MNNHKMFFKQTLINSLGKEIEKSVEMSINGGTDSRPLLAPLGNVKQTKKIYLNCTLTQDPIIKDDYIALPFNGSFVNDENGNEF